LTSPSLRVVPSAPTRPRATGPHGGDQRGEPDGPEHLEAGANLPLVGTIVIDVPYATTGQCGEAKFTVTPPAKPSCLSTSGGKTVKCK